ncbi:P-loop containing nucleoside triphosphate hydrolase protein [Xylaria scruposa]|nr:P-loop containing nucleoside triphosphate hydrolase protein [Xylaria scruposa]
MSLLSLPIIYITGATACGKGTLGKMLAHNFELYHISIGDLKREHLAHIRAGLPGMAEPIKKLAEDGQVIPNEMLKQYEVVPAVLQYYNHRASNGRGTWTTNLAAVMLNEAVSNANTLARESGLYKGIVIDGHPLSSGKISENIVKMFKAAYAGLTIVMDSPREVARQRYLERARSPGKIEEVFEKRMDLTDLILPAFIELMAGYGDIVYSTNEGTMSIDDAYESLLAKLQDNNAWLAFTNQTT